MVFSDGLASFVSWLPNNPWAFAVPYGVEVLVDWGLGSIQAKVDGTFNRNRVFDWIQTTVGWKQSAAIVTSIVGVYFLQGQHSAYLALLPLLAVNGAASVVVLRDIEEKLVALFAAPKK